ncbi:universal stress protein [Arthrobacter wenxiniae]|uniref:Universal stress protein n=1 Tax=Arthrobacter wenxiniae TaxID=2713570 RepID=A0A7Y7IEY6_9MICC|nr:universal stress protein [Arthrobacter wenxiniae]NVM94233.1 universal stress protein [Arthrobacter wenxiniae]
MNTEAVTGRVVVGVDGSASSVMALREAQHIAQATGARLDVVSCWNIPATAAPPVESIAEGIKEAAWQRLQEEVAVALGSPAPDNVSTRLLQGQPRQELIELSKGSDLLVVGRRGFGGFAGLLMGSVSRACVAHAHCPVMVVNAGERDERSRDVASPAGKANDGAAHP